MSAQAQCGVMDFPHGAYEGPTGKWALELGLCAATQELEMSMGAQVPWGSSQFKEREGPDSGL